MKTIISLFVLTFLFSAHAKNLHVVDDQGAFKMVRTGKPDFEGFKKMCQLGVRKMFVMAGNGSIEETFAKTPWAQENCKGFEVIYNCKQSTKVPLSKEYLNRFDEEVAKAKKEGYAVAFRCNCGCHRTGRLAAYYRMKYMGKSVKDSVKDQRRNAPGFATLLYRGLLKHQINALNDYIQGKDCSEDPKYCVIEKDPSCGSPAQDDLDDSEIDEKDGEVPLTETETVPESNPGNSAPKENTNPSNRI